MEKSSQKKRRHKRSFVSRIKKILDKLFYPQETNHKEYRPYLGGDAKTPLEHEDRSSVHKAKRKKHHHSHKSKKKKFSFGLTNFFNRLEKNKAERKRRKHKKHLKRKHQKKKAKENRIELIRKFIPNYKKKPVTSFEFSQDDHQEDHDKEKQKLKGYLSYTANSTAYFILAYLILYLLYQLTVLIAASHFKLDSVLLYYDLAFNDFSPLWNRTNIIIVTFSGPFISLLMGVLFLKVLTNRSKLKKSAKLFMLWIGIHGYNLFLGAFAAGVSFDEGFGYVPAWLFWNVFWQISVSLIFLFILGMISYYSAPKFLDTSYSQTRIRQQNKIKFLFFQVVLPWAIGSLIIFLIKIPNNMPYESSTLLTLVFATVPVLFNRHAKPTKNYKIEKRSGKIKIWLLVVVVAALALYRIGLNNGLHISLFYDFIFNIDIKPL